MTALAAHNYSCIMGNAGPNPSYTTMGPGPVANNHNHGDEKKEIAIAKCAIPLGYPICLTITDPSKNINEEGPHIHSGIHFGIHETHNNEIGSVAVFNSLASLTGDKYSSSPSNVMDGIHPGKDAEALAEHIHKGVDKIVIVECLI